MLHVPHHTAVYRTEEIRRIEALAQIEPGASPLMERAGLAAAERARDMAASGAPILIYAGPGNNGGDAFVVARHLKAWWFNVSVVFAGEAAKLPVDAAEALKAWLATGGTVLPESTAPASAGLVVDGLFGIGLTRPPQGRYAALVDEINASRAPVLALDVPSGLESDSGRVLGCAVRADHTISFIGLKSGLLTLDGPDHCGNLEIAGLGLNAAALLPPRGRVIAGEVMSGLLAPRSRNTHKGNFGSVGIIGGARGMVGAALLAGRAALNTGAGRVYVGLAEDGALVDLVQPELMVRPAAEVLGLDHLSCVAVGPGLGTSKDAEALLASALALKLPLVLDADALNLIAVHGDLRSALSRRESATVLTPHPAEAARMLGVATSQVQHDRVAAAVELAAAHGSSVVIKGAGSVCAAPDGTWAINTSGNPGMASAGMGDMLTGIVTALIAQGVGPRAALEGGVYLHGAAADAVAARRGMVGLTASEVIGAARDALNATRASSVRERADGEDAEERR